ncbi:hypothetical protein ABZ249_18755 [Nocardiopsis sp. NPDC006139]|uniref:hypothetical protein n=1 Tax=Nocardiopsis sp. NPDC006139 TaxID=3154578 RepID=UPI0033A5BC49
MRNVPLRSLPSCLVLLAPIALLAACSSPGPGLEFLPAGSGYGTGPGPTVPPPEAPSPRVDPSALPGAEPAGTPFGEPVAVPFPVGAYEHEHDGTAEVLYTVDDVAATAPGTVGFSLTVEVPDLGRVFGMGNMAVTCDAGDGPVAAVTDDAPGEAEAGTHAFAMECPVPEGSGELLVAVEHHGERLEFTGVPG